MKCRKTKHFLLISINGNLKSADKNSKSNFLGQMKFNNFICNFKTFIDFIFISGNCSNMLMTNVGILNEIVNLNIPHMFFNFQQQLVN